MKPVTQKNTQVKVTNYTKKTIAKEKAAKGMLWMAAGITLGILIIIVGYILYRGFVSDTRKDYDVINKGDTKIYADANSDDYIYIIANSAVDIKELTVFEAHLLFSGRRMDWGKLSDQDIDTSVYVLKDDCKTKSIFEKTIMAKKLKYSRVTEYLDSEKDIIEKVSKAKGGLGYISKNSLDLVNDNKKIRVLKIRRISIVANPDVTATVNNRRLQYLSHANTQDLFRGAVKNWSEVDGHDMDVKIVSFSKDSNIYKEFNQLNLDGKGLDESNVIYVETEKEMLEQLEKNTGAVGYCYYNDAFDLGKQLISVRRHEVKQNLKLSFIVTPPKKAGQVGGVSTVIVNTIVMVLLTIALAGPIGVAAAIYMTEYAKQGRLIRILRFGTETLAGIPSIIFGLFGLIFFVILLKLGIGLLSGVLTLTFMILPTIIRTSEEAIKTVPQSFREGSLALGATKWQTIARVVVPAAMPGVLTGIILGMGRAIGETAALLFTMGTNYELLSGLKGSACVLSLHLYILAKEGISFDKAFATATILIFVILIINYITNALIGKMSKLGEGR